MSMRPYPSYWLYRDAAGQWRWRFDASNGRTIAVSSESYLRKADCQRGIDLLRGSAIVPVWSPGPDLQAR
jgi:uncharacterized protein YegP (UPF0339 family)